MTTQAEERRTLREAEEANSNSTGMDEWNGEKYGTRSLALHQGCL